VKIEEEEKQERKKGERLLMAGSEVGSQGKGRAGQGQGVEWLHASPLLERWQRSFVRGSPWRTRGGFLQPPLYPQHGSTAFYPDRRIR
jgi:hypothetical protein